MLSAIQLRSQDVSLIEELAGWQIEEGRFVEALQSYRKVRRYVGEAGDEAALARAQVKVKALAILAGEQDVLRAGHPGAGEVRRSIEAIARKQGL